MSLNAVSADPADECAPELAELEVDCVFSAELPDYQQLILTTRSMLLSVEAENGLANALVLAQLESVCCLLEALFGQPLNFLPADEDVIDDHPFVADIALEPEQGTVTLGVSWKSFSLVQQRWSFIEGSLLSWRKVAVSVCVDRVDLVQAEIEKLGKGALMILPSSYQPRWQGSLIRATKSELDTFTSQEPSECADVNTFLCTLDTDNNCIRFSSQQLLTGGADKIPPLCGPEQSRGETLKTQVRVFIAEAIQINPAWLLSAQRDNSRSPAHNDANDRELISSSTPGLTLDLRNVHLRCEISRHKLLYGSVLQFGSGFALLIESEASLFFDTVPEIREWI